MDKSGPARCRVTAMNLLARREHSRKELHQKLTSRHFEDAVIEETLLALAQERLQSDERFVEVFVKSKVEKGLGPLRIRQALSEHNIPDELISDYLVDQQWVSLAVGVRQKRFGFQIPSDYNARAKQMRFLQYRGFSHEQINSAMRQCDDG